MDEDPPREPRASGLGGLRRPRRGRHGRLDRVPSRAPQGGPHRRSRQGRRRPRRQRPLLGARPDALQLSARGRPRGQEPRDLPDVARLRRAAAATSARPDSSGSVPEKELPRLEKNVAMQRAHGVDARVVDRAELAEIVPDWNVDDVPLRRLGAGLGIRRRHGSRDRLSRARPRDGRRRTGRRRASSVSVAKAAASPASSRTRDRSRRPSSWRRWVPGAGRSSPASDSTCRSRASTTRSRS